MVFFLPASLGFAGGPVSGDHILDAMSGWFAYSHAAVRHGFERLRTEQEVPSSRYSPLTEE